MRLRTFGLILILIAVVAVKSVQPVSAAGGCDTHVNYDIPNDWYTITANKTYPEKPVVKQHRENKSQEQAFWKYR